MKRLIRWIGNIILGLLVIITLISAATFISTRYMKESVPGIGNIKFLTVLSGSMAPVFRPYDVIIDLKLPMSGLKAGDIITFKKEGFLVTHRIVGIQMQNDEAFYKTRGDANNVDDEGLTAYSDVVGKYEMRLPYLGFILSYAEGPIGIILFWVLILYLVIKEILSAFKDKDKKFATRKENPPQL